MYSIVAEINGVLWGDVLVYMLLFAGVWFSLRLRLVQLFGFTQMFALLKSSRQSDSSGISSFQALCTSLSARVGTGNLAGVAIAISVGGPGAVFWMWIIAFLGMGTAFAESLLAQVYKVRNSKGEFRGGPAYYIRMGLQRPWLAAVFSLSLMFGYTLVFNATQANTIADALNHAYDIPTLYTGLIVCAVAALVVIGGLRSIAKVSEWLVPIMAGLFMIAALFIMLVNLDRLPSLLAEIVRSAFGFSQVAGATFALAVQNGVTRGLYSNEAGAGSVPQAAAAASPKPNHPATQGYIQMLGVFIDTIVICTCTAMIIMLAGDYSGVEMTGIRMTQAAMTEHIGHFGGHFVSLAITLFAFTSIIGNYAYAESNLYFFKLDNTPGRSIFTVVFLLMTFLGTQAELKLVWAMADLAFGLMAVINVSVILVLTPTVCAVAYHYWANFKLSQKTQFSAHSVKVQGTLADDVWT